jgi:hypothetical protein
MAKERDFDILARRLPKVDDDSVGLPLELELELELSWIWIWRQEVSGVTVIRGRITKGLGSVR